MIRLTRRHYIGLCLAAGGAAFSYKLVTSGPEQVIRRALVRSFGNQIANHSESTRFIEDFLVGYHHRANQESPVSRMKNWAVTFGLPLNSPRELRDQIVPLFLTSTNVVRAVETGEDLNYVVLFDPYTSPCTNQLGANWI
jgi:hypothetical protein